jgi:hypothetical protein
VKLSKPARYTFASAIGFMAWITPPDFTAYIAVIIAAVLFVAVSRGERGKSCQKN